jgi:hypothetical protein
LKRLGPDPHANGAATPSLQGCPDISERHGGDFAVIGQDITGTACAQLPADAGCGPDERIVWILSLCAEWRSTAAGNRKQLVSPLTVSFS